MDLHTYLISYNKIQRIQFDVKNDLKKLPLKDFFFSNV